MKTYITSKITGIRIEIDRCATATNPRWVYVQTETENQSQLNEMLDAYNVEDFYARGKHLGPDFIGIEMLRDDNDQLCHTMTDDDLDNSVIADMARRRAGIGLRAFLNQTNAWALSVGEVRDQLQKF